VKRAGDCGERVPTELNVDRSPETHQSEGGTRFEEIVGRQKTGGKTGLHVDTSGIDLSELRGKRGLVVQKDGQTLSQ